MTTFDHDPGDEDRSVDSYCRNCGDPFDRAAEDAALTWSGARATSASVGWRPCPKPSPGRWLVDCGIGGHMYDDRIPSCS